MIFEEAKRDAARMVGEVVELMKNRLIVGALRYGRNDATNVSHDFLANARRRMEKYEADGNREHLVDAMNYLLLEFKLGIHPKGHFRAQGDAHHEDAIRR